MKNERLIVDRIEGEYAVCEHTDGHMEAIPLVEFKQTVSEGDVFYRQGTEYILSPDEKKQRQKENIKLQDSLFED